MSNPKVSHEPDIPDCEVSGQTMRQQESSIVQPNSLDKMASESNPYFIPSSPNLNSAIFKGSIFGLGTSTPDLTATLKDFDLANLAVDLMIHDTQLGPIEKVGILDPHDHIPVVAQSITPPTSRILKTLSAKSPPPSKFIRLKTNATLLFSNGHRSSRYPCFEDEGMDLLGRIWIGSGASFSGCSHTLRCTSTPPLVLLPLRPSEALRSFERNTPIHPDQIRQFFASRFPCLPIFSAGGLAARLLAALTSSSPDTEPSLVEVNTIVAYVAEGDNRLDAKTFAHEILSIFNHLRSDKGDEPAPISFDSLREPISWKASDSYQTKHAKIYTVKSRRPALKSNQILVTDAQRREKTNEPRFFLMSTTLSLWVLSEP
ncbi:hypothetical protein PSTT_11700 [Puccinia striiformis]|uniref:Uncharacterized protein n=1 Tax=Puccinia striiformis TaxID=27350 RepID=A0A2S4UZB1_9BASI|nr:hypothetical protein PSTT_11700 [Puccinia striiformis]